MKIIYLLLDAISYKHSWLNNKNLMPNLNNFSKVALNFHNHYSVTHNTRGNIASMLSGVSSSLTKVMGRKQSFRKNKFNTIQKKIREHGYSSNYFGTQPLFQSEIDGDKLDFDVCKYYSPSMSDFYIPAENFNVKVKEDLEKIEENSFSIFHYTDCHEPYETPLNILNKKDFPNIFKFHYRISNLIFRIPRKFFLSNFSYKNIKTKNKVFKNYPWLKTLCPNPFGAISTPERYSWFYETVWSNKDFQNEYEKMMNFTLKYTDIYIDKILNYIKDKHYNSVIFISSDHGNNGIIHPDTINSSGRLNESATHVPLSIVTFNEKIKKKFSILGERHFFTSHTNLFNTILNLIEPQKYSDKKNLLHNEELNDYVFSEINDSRWKFGECRMRKNNKEIFLKLSATDNLENMKLISKEDILNEISSEDYNNYYMVKNKLNKTLFDRY